MSDVNKFDYLVTKIRASRVSITSLREALISMESRPQRVASTTRMLHLLDRLEAKLYADFIEDGSI